MFINRLWLIGSLHRLTIGTVRVCMFWIGFLSPSLFWILIWMFIYMWHLHILLTMTHSSEFANFVLDFHSCPPPLTDQQFTASNNRHWSCLYLHLNVHLHVVPRHISLTMIRWTSKFAIFFQDFLFYPLPLADQWFTWSNNQHSRC